MKYSEATQITGVIFDEWSKEDKLELMTKCIRYFFSDSLIKPCPLLNGDVCSVYSDRPLSCRIYGLWPEDVWDERVSNFSKVIGLPKDKLPLNKQCEMVRRANNLPPLTMDQINQLYTSLDSIDMMVGNLGEEQIKQQWNSRTLHDWILLKFYGEEKLIIMSEMKSKARPEEIEEIIKIVTEGAAKLL